MGILDNVLKTAKEAINTTKEITEGTKKIVDDTKAIFGKSGLNSNIISEDAEYIVNASPPYGYQPYGLLYRGLVTSVTTETLGDIKSEIF